MRLREMPYTVVRAGCVVVVMYPNEYYTIGMYFTLHRTAEFDTWLTGLRDPVGKARIIQRLDAAVAGHWGDCEPVGAGVFEMRVHSGPSYRVYAVRRGTVVYLLLCGGDKSTQRRDINRAKTLAKALPEEALP